MTVRTRFAPSPTGMLHIGGVRTALFSWLYARHHDGIFILRIEDTDRERSTDEAIQVILDGMAWLGLTADEGPYYQTRRYDRYRKVVSEWLASGTAYHCYCTKEELEALRAGQLARREKPRYDGRCRNGAKPRAGIEPVVRFKNPLEGTVIVHDLVHGAIEFQNSELDDLIIMRSDGNPTYNFCVAVDDSDMAITHVVRGDDHINNTPRQLNMLSALGANPPAYAHLPMILGADGTKLSKRHGAVSVLEYREQGYLPDALLNYLGRLGWSHGDQEIFTLSEMAALFELDAVNKSAAALNPEKLAWTNQQHMMRATGASLASMLAEQLTRIGVEPVGRELAAIADCLKERTRTLREMAEASRFFFQRPESYEEKAARKHLTRDTTPLLRAAAEDLANLEPWSASTIHAMLEALAAKRAIGLGRIAQPIRVAVSGSSISPPIDATLAILGRQESLARIERAIEYGETSSVA
jgi:glutamyl-tRNA synthetase